MASLVALGAFLFLDIEKKSEPVVWDLNLQTLKYKDLSFEKQSTFQGDRFYTSFTQDGKSYRYRASTAVPNLFQEFEELKMHGLYALEGEVRKLFPEELFGESEETRCVQLMPVNEDSFKLCVANKDRNGKLFAVANRPANEGEAYLVAKYTMDRLDSDRTSFLERRVFLYPTASSTIELNVTLLSNPLNIEDRNLPYTVHLFRKEKMQKDAGPMMIWVNQDGKEAEAQFANPLDTVIRQFQIKFFSFEYKQDPSGLWEKAEPVLEAKMVAGVDGEPVETMSVEVRQPREPLMVQGEDLLLMSSPAMDGIQVIDRETIKRTIGYIKGLQAMQPSDSRIPVPGSAQNPPGVP
ncbi:MAG TPA: hypothetical protein DEA96_16580 [Leptospiraceae bacterium]|nr:hypothetical protein [Spirochaetaceae bacterium]HBS06587.1 hypothetical protein [Leptospiraceae bacterium]|tara:strand:+ start:28748 stop:29800 length:1053 start_codon:yes stop_codon:yes gene_type:complete